MSLIKQIMAKYARINKGGHRTDNNCCATLALLILLITFIALFVPNGKVDLISDNNNNTYVYVDGISIPCEEYSEYRAYDYCKDEWKIPMG